MNNLQELMEKAGLSKGESKVYLALIEIGISTIGPIVTKSGVSSSKVYKILDKLSKKGLVSSIVKEKTKHFKIENPNHLLEFLENKEKEIQSIKLEIDKNLPQLMEKIKLAENKSACTVYEGFKGLKSVFDKSLSEIKKDDIMYVSGISESTEEIRNYFIHYYKTQAKIGFKVKAIFDESAKNKAKERKNKNTEFRFMPKGTVTPATFVIYGDKTIIEVGNKNYILTILIKNKEISESFKKHFELLWKLAK